MSYGNNHESHEQIKLCRHELFFSFYKCSRTSGKAIVHSLSIFSYNNGLV